MSGGCEDDGGPAGAPRAERLNRGCFCRTLDEPALARALGRELGDAVEAREVLDQRPHLFSRVPVFLQAREHEALVAVVRAIETVVRNPGYQAAVLEGAVPIARRDFGPRGVLMGYDFHLSADGPRLIEVNTNAGGAFLNALLGQAQRACCVEAGVGLEPGQAEAFAEAARRMFAREWRLQGRSGAPRRIAIVDDAPAEQFLYPEFLLAQRVLRAMGAEVLIVDPQDLAYRDGALQAAGGPVDLVYNRLVDFALEAPAHRALGDAYADGAVVVTPNPHLHALYADKRNLVLLSDPAKLAAWAVGSGSLKALAGVPKTVLVTAETAEALWRERKAWFFKPTRGHGSKGVYRGEKLTRRVWSDIVAGDYVAQAYSPPSERRVEVDGRPEPRKLDVRLYTYDGEILLSAARLYQGQATNLRTPGGGFAPLFVV